MKVEEDAIEEIAQKLVKGKITKENKSNLEHKEEARSIEEDELIEFQIAEGRNMHVY